MVSEDALKSCVNMVEHIGNLIRKRKLERETMDYWGNSLLLVQVHYVNGSNLINGWASCENITIRASAKGAILELDQSVLCEQNQHKRNATSCFANMCIEKANREEIICGS